MHPRAGRGAALGKGANHAPGGGRARLVACLPCLCFAFLPPIPPTPFPAGRGRPKLFSCKGLRPLHPRGLTRAALGKGANHAPAGGVPGWSPAYPAFALLSCPHPPVPLPGGKGEIFCLFRRGLPPPAPLRLNPYGAGSTLGKQFLWVMPETFPSII